MSSTGETPNYIFRASMAQLSKKDAGQQEGASGGLFEGPTIDISSSQTQKDKHLHGQEGKATKLTTNYLTLTFDQGQPIFEYDIEFPSNIRSKAEKLRVLDAIRRRNIIPKDIPWASDAQTVWLLKSLFADSKHHYGAIEYTSLNGFSNGACWVELKYKRTLKTSNIREDMLNQENPHPAITAINAFISQKIEEYAADKVMRVGQNKFFYNAGYKELGPTRHGSDNFKGGLLAIRGYYVSARPGENRTLLNINTATSAFFRPMLLSEWMIGMMKSPYNYTKKNLEVALKGKRVQLLYHRPDVSNDTIRSVSEIGDPVTDQVFRTDRGEKLLVWRYFKKELSDYTNPQLPCVNIGRATNLRGENRARWVPPEFLEIEPNQLFTGSLTGCHLSEMINAACRKPAQNAYMLYNEGMALFGIRDNAAHFDQSGLVIGQELAKIDARILNPPILQYQKSELKSQKASWNLVPNSSPVKFAISAQFDHLHMLRINFDSSGNAIGSIFRALHGALTKHGVKGPNREMVKTDYFSLKDISRCSNLGEFPELETRLNVKSLKLVILPSNNQDWYPTIKKFADCMYGSRTITCIAEKAARADPQYWSNIALKFNFKAGGLNHRLKSKWISLLLKKRNTDKTLVVDTLVLGADVTHPPGRGGTPGCPSIAAVVGSVDENFSNMRGSMRLQTARQEIMESLEDMVVELLLAYFTHDKRKRLPTKILMYRDGVSESQFSAVESRELPAIRRACERAVNGAGIIVHKIEINFYVVSKRHNTRIYPTNLQSGRGRNNNVTPGAVIDRDITLPKRFNYYLLSHDGIQGTSRPAHYIEITNEVGFTADETQGITHDLCYTYARATKAVSYCTAAYYADRLCNRGRDYLHDYLVGNKPAGMKFGESPKALDLRMAREIQDSEYWRTWLRDPNMPEDKKNERRASRKNPWHPNLDNTMFWM